MLDFTPLQYTNEVTEEVLWQAQLPNGYRLYYTPSDDMVAADPERADVMGYTPAVTSDFWHAMRSAKIAWKDLNKARKRGKS